MSDPFEDAPRTEDAPTTEDAPRTEDAPTAPGEAAPDGRPATEPGPRRLDADTLRRVLLLLATGDADGAAAVLAPVADGEELAATVRTVGSPAERSRALGDLLARPGDRRDLANEAYRAAFYLSGESERLAVENPLYAWFLAHRSGPALDKWVHYFPIYHRHLQRYRDRPVRVLEIGVYRGGGLRMWQEYFGPRATVVGLDVDERAREAAGADMVVELGDQADPVVLRAVAERHGPFDVVIDDGGHTMAQQRTTAETLFPLLADGGTLLVEDTHTSYWPEYGGGPGRDGTFLAWVRDRVDDLHAGHSAELDDDTVWARDLDGLHLYDSVVVLDRKRRFRPFSEVAGTSAYLRVDRPTDAAFLDLVAARDEARAHAQELEEEVARISGRTPPGTADEGPAAEELRRAQAALRHSQAELGEVGAELAALRREIDSTRGRLSESWEQIHLMRRSVSWRLTTPIRAVRSLMR